MITNPEFAQYMTTNEHEDFVLSLMHDLEIDRISLIHNTKRKLRWTLQTKLNVNARYYIWLKFAITPNNNYENAPTLEEVLTYVFRQIETKHNI